jgi:hypothetical protein
MRNAAFKERVKMRMILAMPVSLSLVLLTNLPATAQVLVQGPSGGGQSLPGSSGSSDRGGCLKAVGVATKDCVLGYGGSLMACGQMGARGPGGPVGKATTTAACLLHGLDGVQCAQSTAKALEACRPSPVGGNCRSGDRSCDRPDRTCGRIDRACDRPDRNANSCAREISGAARK